MEKGGEKKNHKWFARIGVPGSYRYFYSRAELAAHKTKQASGAIKNATSPEYDQNGYKKNKLSNVTSAVKTAGRRAGRAIKNQTTAQYDSSGHRKKNLYDTVDSVSSSLKAKRRKIKDKLNSLTPKARRQKKKNNFYNSRYSSSSGQK